MKPKLEFICTMPGVEEVMPIIRASEYQHSWIKKAVQDMKTNGSIAAPHRRDYEAPRLMPGQKSTDNEERHTAKCPALQMVQNTGWIMRLQSHYPTCVLYHLKCWTFCCVSFFVICTLLSWH